jgi:hypothetical protein
MTESKYCSRCDIHWTTKQEVKSRKLGISALLPRTYCTHCALLLTDVWLPDEPVLIDGIPMHRSKHCSKCDHHWSFEEPVKFNGRRYSLPRTYCPNCHSQLYVSYTDRPFTQYQKPLPVWKYPTGRRRYTLLFPTHYCSKCELEFEARWECNYISSGLPRPNCFRCGTEYIALLPIDMEFVRDKHAPQYISRNRQDEDQLYVGNKRNKRAGWLRWFVQRQR